MGIVAPHVHCRKSLYKVGSAEYIGHALSVAERAGVDAIFDEPNTIPDPITTREQVIERLEIAKSYNSKVFYGLHIGLTSDSEQIYRAVDVCREFSPKPGDSVGVVGTKTFFGKSVGNLEIIKLPRQKGVWDELGHCGYEGVSTNHLEKEKFMRPWLWDPRVPTSHSLARPAIAEIESIKDQVKFLYDSNFKGTFHIAHVSTPKAVDYINAVRNNEVSTLKITCGATPHHLFLNTRMMEELGPKNGLLWKVNPPLRSEAEQRGLLDRLKSGKINWIETDHAPHLLVNKTGEAFDDDGKPIYMSGIPGLDSWPKVIERLKREGFDNVRIRELTRDNVLEVYGIPEGVIGDSPGIGDINLNEYPYGYGDALLV